MVVLTLSKCPQGLKGDVTKWLIEVNTGIYVGKISARVRELLWKRVCDYSGDGEATMVFSARNEQGFSFYVHNTTWHPVDYDGIILPKKPLPQKSEKTNPKRGDVKKSSEKKRSPVSSSRPKQMQQQPVDITMNIAQEAIVPPSEFVAIDLETTGLKSNTDSIIELAAVRYSCGSCLSQYHALVHCEKDIPENIVALTGIDRVLLEEKGRPIEEAVKGLFDFIGEDIIIGHYISFDMQFLLKTCKRINMSLREYQVIDTVALTKELGITDVENYRLATLVKLFGISEGQEHRALPDAVLAAELYLKLTEKMKAQA